MTIGKQVVEQLRQIASGAAAPSDGTPLVVTDQAYHAQVSFSDRDRYSLALHELALGSDAPAPADTHAYLSAAAAAVARRLSFLEEPLAVWELDGGECSAQLRSSPPLREGDDISYWEVVLTAGAQTSARATRYRWTPDMTEREVIAYPATFALIGRMTDALADALVEPIE